MEITCGAGGWTMSVEDRHTSEQMLVARACPGTMKQDIYMKTTKVNILEGRTGMGNVCTMAGIPPAGRPSWGHVREHGTI